LETAFGDSNIYGAARPATLTTPRADDRDAPGLVLVVDDNPASLALLKRLLEHDRHTVVATADSSRAVSLVREVDPDLVLLDVLMPAPNGFAICQTLKNDPATLLTPVVLLTALDDSNAKIQGIEAGADDFVTKPANFAELRARVRSLLRLRRYTQDLDSAESVIVSLAQTIEARDASTDGHCQRLAMYATALGRALGLDADDLAALKRGGYLHDIGKIAIPDAILLKPARLTADEYKTIQQHPIIGDRLCGELRSLRHVRPIVRHHHERLDGSGYPDGLRGDEIPLLAQIMSVVDVFDALTTVRPYKRAYSVSEALAELRREAARGWRRRDLVEAFARLKLPSLVEIDARARRDVR
jgi:putative two-component system response regulator